MCDFISGNLRVEIIGPRERFIEEGSELTLTCVITAVNEPSNVVYWYHGSTLIDYNSPRGGVNLKVIFVYQLSIKRNNLN